MIVFIYKLPKQKHLDIKKWLIRQLIQLSDLKSQLNALSMAVAAPVDPKEKEAEKKVEKQAENQTEKNKVYKDGTFQGTAKGFGGNITVDVKIKNDVLEAIHIVSADHEDKAYLDTATKVIDTILKQQTADVDTVSGATFSSTGLRDAVAEALKKAAN